MQNHLFRILIAIALSTPLFLNVGCGGSGEAKYLPSEDVAKEALNAALKAWQGGQAHGTVKTFAVPVDTFDARWQAGKALEKFEVVRTEALENHKAFIVKMKLTDEEVEQEVTYIVIGNDPLMVFRKEDYDKASGVGGG